MRILHVNAAYWPFVGGAETYAREISERLVQRGHQVTFVTTNATQVEHFWNPRKPHISPGRENVGGVQVIRCRVAHLPISPWSFYLFRRLAIAISNLSVDTTPVMWAMARYMPWVPDIEATLGDLPGPFDLVHGINVALEWPLLAAARYAKQRGLPFVITPFVHVGEAHNPHVMRHYVMRHQLESLRQGDVVFTQTGLEADALKQLGLEPNRLRRLGMGVNFRDLEGGVGERFRQQHNLAGPLITFMGSVTRDKGALHLVEAMRELWDKGRQISLVIAGPPADEFLTYYARLPQAVKDKALLIGPVLGQDKRDLFAATTALAVPSRIDSFGIVYLEAWACSKPVIGAGAGGVPDVIADGEDGLLVPYGDVPALAQAIARLSDDPALAVEMGARGRAKVERSYTWDKIFGIVESAYEELVRH